MSLLLLGLAAAGLLLTNPSKSDFADWFVRWEAAHTRRAHDASQTAFRQALGRQFVEANTRSRNFGFFSTFEIRDYEGKTAVAAVGVCGRIIPTVTPDPSRL